MHLSTPLTATGSTAKPPPYVDGPRLLADIGGTNARFGLSVASGVIESVRVLPCTGYSGLAHAASEYLAACEVTHVRHAAVAIATAVQGDNIRMTNNHWAFSIEESRRALGLDTLVVVNDFTALARSLPLLGADDLVQVGGGHARPRAAIGLVGAGTGLGVGGLLPTGKGWRALDSEGGHVSFSPADERELAVLAYCRKFYPHVSAERLMSGPGIEMLYRALAEQGARAAEQIGAPDIVRRGLEASDDLCVQTLDCFCAMLGTVAGNVALTLGALGGVYIGGGIVPRLGEFFAKSRFRERFENKGRMSGYLAGIPTFAIVAPFPALSGVMAILQERLDAAAPVPMLESVRKLADQLTPAERRVAQLVLAEPRYAADRSIADIARRAEVSQPTVLRFCRSFGCDGLADFKRKLAAALGNAQQSLAAAHAQSARTPQSAHIEGTISSLIRSRDELSAQELSRATELLAGAHQIAWYARSEAAIAARDAQHRFTLAGMTAMAHIDPVLQETSAARLEPGDVAVFVCPEGRLEGLEPVLRLAARGGASLIAVAPAGTPLARRAHLNIRMASADKSDPALSTAQRAFMLLLVDMLAIGASMVRDRNAVSDKRRSSVWRSGSAEHWTGAGEDEDTCGPSSSAADGNAAATEQCRPLVPSGQEA